MIFDYFYGKQADQFAFYRVPKMLFAEEKFWNVSTDAKMLYGILLDRMNLSAENGWLDDEGRVYIIFTIGEIKTSLGCAEKKAVKLLDELEKKCGLIERKRQGLGKPNLIYVKNFVCNGVQREHNKKLNNGLPILHKVPPKRDYGRYFCIMAEKGGTSHGGLTEKLSLFFHAKKQEVNAYGR